MDEKTEVRHRNLPQISQQLQSRDKGTMWLFDPTWLSGWE
jgi:hypothetical protein